MEPKWVGNALRPRPRADPGRIRTEEKIVRDIKKVVMNRVESRSSISDSILNRILCCKWEIISVIPCQRSVK
jgi:hypothetical protein